MRPLLNSREMKKCDEHTMEYFGIPSCVLMERAALKIVEALEAQGLCQRSIGIVCGTGNNGGDGLAAARLLYLKGWDVVWYLAGDPARCSAECKRQYEICQKYQVPQADAPEALMGCDVLVDAVFGIGLSRDIEGSLRELIDLMDQSGAYKVAVDIPSGISADTGNVMGTACRCDLTVTFGFGKAGQYLMPGAAYCGKVIVADMGIGEESLRDLTPRCWAMEERDLALLQPPELSRHKGSAGRVLVVAGSEQMAGAAYFSAKAAYVMGCGMVKIFTPARNHSVLQGLIPEAIIIDYDKKFQEKELLEQIQWADVILMGPGLGMNDTAKKIVSFVLGNAAVPVVCDADCLNIFAGDMQMLKRPHTELILTPHMGEMGRMTQESILYLKDHMLEAAAEFAMEYQVTCVLKDARTVTCVPYHRTYIQTAGNPGMATAGSGDVLAGVIAGCVAQCVPVQEAAALGVMIHGMAGDTAAKEKGMRSLMASDIIDGISKVLRRKE